MAQDTQGQAFRLPVFQGILPVDRSGLGRDVLAGFTLAALAIPGTMGYTKIIGTPVITGLYTILIPMSLFAIFGSSRHLSVGADSATAAVVAAGLAGMAVRGSNEWLALCSLLALLAAVFMFAARVLRLGFLADFLSRTVLTGFLTGVGVQVALLEVSGLLGLQRTSNEPLTEIVHDLRLIGEANPYAVCVSLAVLAVILGGKRISDKIPGGLIAVVAAIGVSWAMDLGAHLETLGAVPSGLPTLALPHVEWSWALIQKLLPIAFACFVVILAQSAATSRAYAAKYNDRFDENVDMVGLGMANLGAGLSGTFIVNGSPTNTAMVDSGGGRSQVSQLTASGIVLVVLLFLTGPLAHLPTAVLSAIVFLVAVRMIDVKGMRRIFVEARAEFWVALLTAATVVVIGVEQGSFLPWCCRYSITFGVATGEPMPSSQRTSERRAGRPFRSASHSTSHRACSFTFLVTACTTPTLRSLPRRFSAWQRARRSRRWHGCASRRQRSATSTSRPRRCCAIPARCSSNRESGWCWRTFLRWCATSSIATASPRPLAWMRSMARCMRLSLPTSTSRLRPLGRPQARPVAAHRPDGGCRVSYDRPGGEPPPADLLGLPVRESRPLPQVFVLWESKAWAMALQEAAIRLNRSSAHREAFGQRQR
jgi:SulP family sulfate permease